jgi:hypothetical protein
VNPEESKEATRPREEPHPVPARPDRKRRTGSRFLLAVALAGCVIGAVFAGARISDFLCDIAGITSTWVRLGGKVAVIAILLPAWFYLVERLFLSRSSRGGRNP